MNSIAKIFLAGAFLGAGAVGAFVHATWAASITMESVIPALTVADLAEAAGAVVAGVVALFVVRQQEARGR